MPSIRPSARSRAVGLTPGSTIPLNSSSTYPTTEQTLSSLSTVVNGGGLGQIGDIVHNFSAAVSGREPEIRELLTRLDNFVGVLDAQRDNIIASIQQLNRVAGTFAGQRDVIDRALKEIPPALDVLIKERPTLTQALTKLGQFSDTASGLVNDAGDDLVTDLKNLEPALKALVDIGPDLSSALIWATAFPYGPGFADTITRGDYINLTAVFDLTYPRLKKTLLARYPVGRRERQTHSGAGRSVLPQLLVQPDVGSYRAPTRRGSTPATAVAGRCAAPDRRAGAAGRSAADGAADAPDAGRSGLADLRGTVRCRRAATASAGADARACRRTSDTGRWWLMLTRFVRNQLIIFTIASIVGVSVMLFTYMQVPTLSGSRPHQRDDATARGRRSLQASPT